MYRFWYCFIFFWLFSFCLVWYTHCISGGKNHENVNLRSVWLSILNLIAKRISEPQYFFVVRERYELKCEWKSEREWEKAKRYIAASFLSPGSLFYGTQINQLQPVINDDNHKMETSSFARSLLLSLSLFQHVNTMTCEINNLYTIRRMEFL